MITNSQPFGKNVRKQQGFLRICRVKRDQIVLVVRLVGCENFVRELVEFIFNALINLEPVQRSDDGCDMK